MGHNLIFLYFYGTCSSSSKFDPCLLQIDPTDFAYSQEAPNTSVFI
jgi:hypothetical protein